MGFSIVTVFEVLHYLMKCLAGMGKYSSSRGDAESFQVEKEEMVPVLKLDESEETHVADHCFTSTACDSKPDSNGRTGTSAPLS